MKRISLMFVCLFSFSSLCGQETNLKENALSAFRQGDYENAIELLVRAKNKDPDDAEIYYSPGYFSHYLAYDSRPLIGHDDN
ncbi:tetratricopeptide repeat protein, partial [candidate division KSB1 bacterium]|nr:tetratricopeptide repeat protein [candidate division KSB1 bacterium]NIS28398.1 tetratricopeptide repeat protein [candidate division KSB1 bacterium]NIT75278.1 tetratricopeptide repeat protein [candidate division KSB1 bacterium]NIU29126.1 tetratricopeptide repeat protein [candidate division KSB1 bacterium]NIU89880.1 tetratricopeptide repeat protein [candidate division KSB1 bacterium]